MTVQVNRESFTFQAEAAAILNLMVYSLYSSKEIFLRELISNASDVIGRLRLELLAQNELPGEEGPLQIRVSHDQEARTITVSDNGFYSSFIVAERVVLTTRRVGLPAGEAVRWLSDGDGEYILEMIERADFGVLEDETEQQAKEKGHHRVRHRSRQDEGDPGWQGLELNRNRPLVEHLNHNPDDPRLPSGLTSCTTRPCSRSAHASLSRPPLSVGSTTCSWPLSMDK